MSMKSTHRARHKKLREWLRIHEDCEDMWECPECPLFTDHVIDMGKYIGLTFEGSICDLFNFMEQVASEER